MATVSQDTQWNHTCSVVATLCNVNRGKNQKAVKPEDLHPSKGRNGMGGNPSGLKGTPLRANNIGILKAFVRKPGQQLPKTAKAGGS